MLFFGPAPALVLHCGESFREPVQQCLDKGLSWLGSICRHWPIAPFTSRSIKSLLCKPFAPAWLGGFCSGRRPVCMTALRRSAWASEPALLLEWPRAEACLSLFLHLPHSPSRSTHTREVRASEHWEWPHCSSFALPPHLSCTVEKTFCAGGEPMHHSLDKRLPWLRSICRHSPSSPFTSRSRQSLLCEPFAPACLPFNG